MGIFIPLSSIYLYYLAMTSQSKHFELIQHLCSTRGISTAEASLLIDEVIYYFQETFEQFVQRRHSELQSAGISNARIYKIILSDIDLRLFPATSTNERKIRRIIYG